MYAPAHAVALWCRYHGSGLPVVLLHGLGDSHELWRHQVDPVAANYRAVEIDLRGHGRSPLGHPDFDLQDMAADVHAALLSIGVERAVVVGLSMGGGVAQALAIGWPKLVLGLVLVSTSSHFPPETRRRFVERAARAEAHGMAAVIEETVPRWFTPAFLREHADEVERTRGIVLDIDPAAFAAASRANAKRNMTEALGRIGCPVLFVGGTLDPADPERAAEVYRRRIAGVQIEMVQGVSHLLPVEAPERFNDILLGFIAEVERTTQQQGGIA